MTAARSLGRFVCKERHGEVPAQLELFEEGGDDVYVYRVILTNEWDMAEEEVIQFYNQRGAKEKVFDQMDNDFGWHSMQITDKAGIFEECQGNAPSLHGVRGFHARTNA